MNKIAIKTLDELADREPAYALVGEVDLCVVRYDDNVSVFYGRCLHRGALMADGHVDGENLILRGPLLGLSPRYRRQRIQQRGSPAQVHLVDRRRRGAGRYRRDRRLGGRASAALQARRVPRPLRRHAPRGRGAPCRAHPGLRQGRAQQDRASRRRRGHGRAAPGPAELGRHPVHHRPAPPHAASRRRARRAPRW